MATKFVAARVLFAFSEDTHKDMPALAFLTNCDVKIVKLRADDRFSHKQYIARTLQKTTTIRATNT